MSAFLEIAIRSSILLAFGLVVWKLSSRGSAEGRCAWLRAVLVGLAVLPFAALFGPQVTFDLPGMAKPEPIIVDASLVEAASGVAAQPERASQWPIAVWLVTAMIAFVPPLLGWNLLRRRWRAGKPLTPEIQQELGEALAELGVKAEVQARIGYVASPLVFGCTRPSMLLPKTFAEWPDSYRRSALLHEAAHIRRFDCAWLAFAAAIRAVYACHPLVWWLSRALRDETELAADERAIRAGVEATDYASALVAIARDLQLNGKLVRSQGVTFMHHRQLENRVRRALAPKRRGFTLFGTFGLFFAALGSAYGIAALRPQVPQPDILVAEGQDTEPTLIQERPLQTTPAEIYVIRTDDKIAGQKPAKVVKASKAAKTTKLKLAKVKPSKAQGTRTLSLAPVATISTVSSAAALAPVASAFPAAAAKPDSMAPVAIVSGVQAAPATAPRAVAGQEIAIARGVPAPTPQDPIRVQGVPLLKELPVVGYLHAAAAAKEAAELSELAKLQKGLSEAEAKQLRELVEKAIREAQKGGEEAKAVTGTLFRTFNETKVQGFQWSPEKRAYQPAKGYSMTVPSRTYQVLKGAKAFNPVEGTLFRTASPLALSGTRINTTGVSEIVITDEKGNRQVIKIKPGSKKSITLQKGKDGKIRVID